MNSINPIFAKQAGADLEGGLFAEELRVEAVREVGVQDDGVVDGQAHELAYQRELRLRLDACYVEPVRPRFLVKNEHAERLRTRMRLFSATATLPLFGTLRTQLV